MYIHCKPHPRCQYPSVPATQPESTENAVAVEAKARTRLTYFEKNPRSSSPPSDCRFFMVATYASTNGLRTREERVHQMMGYVGVASSVRREVVNHSGLRGRWRYIGPVSPRLMTKLLFSFVIFWRKGHSVRGSREDSPAEQAGRPLVREEGQQGSIQRTLQINTPSFSLSPCTFPYCSLECFVVDL